MGNRLLVAMAICLAALGVILIAMNREEYLLKRVQVAHSEGYAAGKAAAERIPFTAETIVILNDPARDWDLAEGAIVECSKPCRFGVRIRGGRVYLAGSPDGDETFRLRPVSDLIVDRLTDDEPTTPPLSDEDMREFLLAPTP